LTYSWNPLGPAEDDLGMIWGSATTIDVEPNKTIKDEVKPHENKVETTFWGIVDMILELGPKP